MPAAITIEELSKQYKLGNTHSGSIRDGINSIASRMLGRRAPKPPSRVENPERLDEVGKFWALRDVSFEVAEGEAIGIIGKNGAGKSTLLKILSRITSPSHGRVEMRGRVASLLEVGTGFHPELTGRENVYLNGTVLGMTKSEVSKQFDAIVDFAGVGDFIDTPVKRYSSGMTVRLGFAVAAHLEPEILIVDEVLAVGDIAFQRKCLSKMRDVAREGRTVLFVSHNLAAVQNLCTSGVVLADGQFLFQGRADEAISTYTRLHAPDRQGEQLSPPEEPVPARATRVALMDGDGREILQVTYGTPWGVRIEFEVKDYVEDLSVGMGMRTVTELGIFNSYLESQNFQPGLYAAEFFEDELTFCAGSYLVAAGISQNGRGLHYVPDALQMDVVPGVLGQEKQPVKTHGILSLNLRTTVSQIATAIPEENS